MGENRIGMSASTGTDISSADSRASTRCLARRSTVTSGSMTIALASSADANRVGR